MRKRRASTSIINARTLQYVYSTILERCIYKHILVPYNFRKKQISSLCSDTVGITPRRRRIDRRRPVCGFFCRYSRFIVSSCPVCGHLDRTHCVLLHIRTPHALNTFCPPSDKSTRVFYDYPADTAILPSNDVDHNSHAVLFNIMFQFNTVL